MRRRHRELCGKDPRMNARSPHHSFRQHTQRAQRNSNSSSLTEISSDVARRANCESHCMSYYTCYITRMARGESGRIVIEVEPEVKRRLYSALALSGSTLKNWFIKSAATFCSDAAQPSLFEHSAKNGVKPHDPAKGTSPSPHSSHVSGPAKRLNRRAPRQS